jgi:hypothetical protein
MTSDEIIPLLYEYYSISKPGIESKSHILTALASPTPAAERKTLNLADYM